MRKSVSLKEFSTTPTVSCMLRKDGTNEGSGGPATGASSEAKPRPPAIFPPPTGSIAKKEETPKAYSADSDVMFEME